jgi:hypothetical protein
MHIGRISRPAFNDIVQHQMSDFTEDGAFREIRQRIRVWSTNCALNAAAIAIGTFRRSISTLKTKQKTAKL